MPTNKERREVAARLRRKEPSSFETVFDVFREIGLAVNPKGGSFKTLPLQLADLIEPEPERTITPVLDKSSWYIWRCPECGKVFEYERDFKVTYTSRKRKCDYPGGDANE